MEKLKQSDYEVIMDFVKKEPHLNLFIIGALLNENWEAGDMIFYGRFENKKLVNVLFSWKNISLQLYAEELNNDDLKFIETIMEKFNIEVISYGGKTANLIQEFINKKQFKVQGSILAVYNPQKQNNLPNSEIKVEVANENDAVELDNLYVDIFGDKKRLSIEELASTLKNKERITYVIKDNGKIVSMASATAFTHEAAMIVGVGTSNDYRQKGYASVLVKRICDDLMKDNKAAALFFENPKAASIYHKLGFIDKENYYFASK